MNHQNIDAANKDLANLYDTHKIHAYDKWFRDQVQASLHDPRPAIFNEAAKLHFALKRRILSVGWVER